MAEAFLGKILNQVSANNTGDIWLSNVIGGGLTQIQSSNRKLVQYYVNGDYFYFVKQLEDDKFIAGSSKPIDQSSNQLKVFFKELELEIPLSGYSLFNKSKFAVMSNKSYLFSAGAEVINFDRKGILASLFTEKKVECLFEDSRYETY